MTWLYALIGISALIVIHEAGHALAAKACGMKVVRFALFFPPIVLRRSWGETEFAIGAIPLGGYVRILGQSPDDEIPADEAERSYAVKPVWQRAIVIAAGPAANIVTAIVLISAILMFDGVSKVVPVVGAAGLTQPAASVFKPGDRIIAVDGIKGDPEVLVNQTRSHRCAGKPTKGCVAAVPAEITFIRQGQEVKAKVSPRWDPTAAAMRLGFSFSVNKEPLGPIAALGKSTSLAWNVSKSSVKGFLAIATPEGRKQVSGIVGVSVVTENAFKQDLVYALELLAFISLLIAVVNLFPLLPLDGGHLFWLAVEAVRRKPVSQETLGRAAAVGMVLVAGLFLIGLSNDVVRLGGSGFSTGR